VSSTVEPVKTQRGPLVWVDCEMTGLDLGADALVEIACVVTDADLEPLDDGIELVIRPPQQALDQMSEFVTEMHRESGLLPLITAGVGVAEAEEAVLEYVQRHVPDARKAPLAGSSIYVDRGFLARDMPRLDSHLHYRVVDVSSIKELVRRWYPKVYFQSPEKTGNHRALGDILDSIAELRYYRSTVFEATPGGSGAGRSGAAGTGTL
jgi:oligoribonuclease